MRKSLLWTLLLGAAIVLLLGACSQAQSSLDGTSWVLKSYQEDQGKEVNVLLGSTTTAQFQSTEVSGISGCNNYSASYQEDKNKLSFGGVATTRKSCLTPPGIMQQEEVFLNAISLVSAYKLKGSLLQMVDGQGNTLLTFSKANE